MRGDVQRKVGGVNRQVPVHGGFQLPVGDAGNGLHGLPENAVVKKEQVRTCFQGRMNGLSEPSTAAATLETVPPFSS